MSAVPDPVRGAGSKEKEETDPVRGAVSKREEAAPVKGSDIEACFMLHNMFGLAEIRPNCTIFVL